MRSFEKLFLLTGLLFLPVLPLPYFLKTEKAADTGRIHVEIE